MVTTFCNRMTRHKSFNHRPYLMVDTLVGGGARNLHYHRNSKYVGNTLLGGQKVIFSPFLKEK